MKLLKLITLAGLVTLCYGQSGDSMSDSPSPSPTPSPNPSPTPTPNPLEPSPDSTVIMVTATRTYFNRDYYRRIYNGTGGIYDSTRMDRYARYNCHDRNGEGIIMNRVPSDYVFTVFLQMPVLHFLELEYKINLMQAIAMRLGLNPTARSINNINLGVFANQPEICIDGYDQAFVGSFDEGIMLRIYGTNMPRPSGEMLRSWFLTNRGGIEEPLYEGLPSIDYGADRNAVIGPTWTSRVSINLGGCRQLDPDYNRFNNASLSDDVDGGLRCRSLNTEEQEDIREELAENPDPINFYLEAGDYVFAVLGSIAVAIVLGLATLGYCIHPFFLA